MSELDEIVGEFLLESYENLDRFDADVLALEQDPTDRERLGAVFRTVHTLKGTCGSFGFDRLRTVAHVAENLLGSLRDGEVVVTHEIADVLLSTGDAVRGMLGDIAATGEEGPSEHAETIAALERLLDAEPTSRSPQPPGGVSFPPSHPGALADPDGPADPYGPADLDTTADPGARTEPDRTEPDRSVRVDVGVLDELTDLVAELVHASDRVTDLLPPGADRALVDEARRVGHVATELQHRVMRTRVRPIHTVWSRFPRLVRDLGASLGKQVELVTEGETTELDRSILGAIRDPLIHLVRNAVDHGIEPPAQRRSLGKAPVGRLVLRARQGAGLVHLEVSDDGAGVDVAAVTRAALDRGVITAAGAATMGDLEGLQLIFLPGLTTVTDVTDVSGRGVGMDVVRTDVERIGGRVDVRTARGEGTTFEVTIPVGLALVPALTAGAALAGERT